MCEFWSPLLGAQALSYPAPWGLSHSSAHKQMHWNMVILEPSTWCLRLIYVLQLSPGWDLVTINKQFLFQVRLAFDIDAPSPSRTPPKPQTTKGEWELVFKSLATVQKSIPYKPRAIEVNFFYFLEVVGHCSCSPSTGWGILEEILLVFPCGSLYGFFVSFCDQVPDGSAVPPKWIFWQIAECLQIVSPSVF